MKIILMSIALFGLFQAVISTRCFSCNWDVQAKKISLNSTDLQCYNPIEVLCVPGTVCGKMSHEEEGQSVVIKSCFWEDSCPAEEYSLTDKDGRDRLVNCCNENFCNGSENVFITKLFFLLLLYFQFLNHFF